MKKLMSKKKSTQEPETRLNISAYGNTTLIIVLLITLLFIYRGSTWTDLDIDSALTSLPLDIAISILLAIIIYDFKTAFAATNLHAPIKKGVVITRLVLITLLSFPLLGVGTIFLVFAHTCAIGFTGQQNATCLKSLPWQIPILLIILISTFSLTYFILSHIGSTKSQKITS